MERMEYARCHIKEVEEYEEDEEEEEDKGKRKGRRRKKTKGTTSRKKKRSLVFVIPEVIRGYSFIHSFIL